MPISEDKINQIASKSEYFQDILEKVPSKIITWGNTGMLFILIMLAIGLKLVKYPDSILSTISIVNETPPIDVYSRSSGRIIHLLKNDQQYVSKGEWVVILNNSANYKDILTVNKCLDQIDLKNYWNSINSENFPQVLTLGEVQGSYFEFLRGVEELQRYTTQVYRAKLSNAYVNRKTQIKSKNSALNSQLNLNQKQLEIAQQDFDRIKKLWDLKVATKIELEQKEVVLLSAKEKLEQTKSNINNANIENELLQKESTSTDIEKDDQYSKLKNDVLEKFNSLHFALSEWISKYVLTSPISGKLNLYDLRNEDQFVTTERKVFTISPLNSKNYYGIIKLPISNSGKVQYGQDCIIKLQNFPFSEFGVLRGKVQSISPLSVDGFFIVKVILPKQLLTTQNRKLHFAGELIGSSEIIIEELTLFDRLFYSIIGKS